MLRRKEVSNDRVELRPQGDVGGAEGRASLAASLVLLLHRLVAQADQEGPVILARGTHRHPRPRHQPP
eukprot:CAMPEP_0185397338 /NCGR_PEP_ID=MMETSP1364-20130426/86584_1 /TAXON_ID=38817 /ORGANISM="Gephyrocapsa oceanica, Strain RCC1303" /LENGTH=67 /DNA_ID=CAMNT_0027999563 /DNA_START=38 /DNA_END=238 /DNA_ORIENTATION=+